MLPTKMTGYNYSGQGTRGVCQCIGSMLPVKTQDTRTVDRVHVVEANVQTACSPPRGQDTRTVDMVHVAGSMYRQHAPAKTAGYNDS